MTSTDIRKSSTSTSSAARKIYSTWEPGPEERNQLIRVAAYFIAEREGFKGDEVEHWAAAEYHVDQMLALRESQEKLQIIIDTALHAVVQIDSAGVISSWNHLAESIFGWSREEAIGRTLHETIFPLRYHEVHLRGMKQFLETGESQSLNCRIETFAQHRDGREFPVELSVVPIKLRDKYEFSAFIHDITARKQVEEKLITIMKAVESTSDAIGISDAQGRHVYQNGALSDLFEYETARELETAGGGAVVVKDAKVAKEMFENIMSGKSWAGELEMVTRSGRVFPAYERADAIKDDDGNIVGLIGIITDISERKRLEAERERLLNIIEDATDFISTSDLQGRIKSLNAAGARMVGLPDGVDVATLGIADFHPEWAARRISEEAMPVVLKKGSWQGECALLHRDGHEIPTSQMVLVHRDDSGKPIYLSTIIRDITEHKKNEEELRRSNAELEQFSYAISHDMRQPLRMISSYMQLLERGISSKIDDEQRENINFAIDGAKRMDAMMLGLLEYSRVGRKGEPPIMVNSRHMIDEALLFLQPAIAEAQAVVHILGEWPRVLVNRDEIVRLVQNLIGNAIKFRVAGRTPEVNVSSEIVANEWRVCISDNGVGILPDQIERLFQVFQRLQSRATYEGTGIGLALCRKIAEHHHGHIWAESAGEGQGSRFCVSFPKKVVEEIALQV